MTLDLDNLFDDTDFNQLAANTEDIDLEGIDFQKDAEQKNKKTKPKQKEIFSEEDSEDDNTIDNDDSSDEEEDQEDELEEDDEDTKYFKKNIVKEKFYQDFVKKEVENQIKEYEEDFLNGLDEDAKDFFEFKKLGGSLKDFLESRNKIGELVSKTDDSNSQKEFLINYYKNKGVDVNIISKSIENLTQDELIKHYESAYNEYEVNYNVNRAELLRQQKEQNEVLIKQQEQNNLKLKDQLSKTEKIFGKSLDSKAKNDFYNYVTRVDKVTQTTKLQEDLMNLFEKKDENFVKFLYMLKNNFSVAGLEKDISSKVVGDIKTKIKQHRKDTNIGGSKKYIDDNNNMQDLANMLD